MRIPDPDQGLLFRSLEQVSRRHDVLPPVACFRHRGGVPPSTSLISTELAIAVLEENEFALKGPPGLGMSYIYALETNYDNREYFNGLQDCSAGGR